MKVSLIISVYKNCKDLQVILEALRHQSYQDFEVIISEDGESEEIKSCLALHGKNLEIIHMTQEDKGFRKNKSLNASIKASTGEYLAFIDGDCIPNPDFIKEHVSHAQEKKIVIGRRAMLGAKMSEKLRVTPIINFTHRYLRYLLTAIKDGTKFFEDGIFIKSNILYNFLAKRRKVRGILGCNFSCYKSAMYEINGFDEDYEKPGRGEDTDIDWRFRKIGYSFVSVRNRAIVYHLDHPRAANNAQNRELFDQKFAAGLVQCKRGLELL